MKLYSKEELTSLADDELIAYYKNLELEAGRYGVLQLALKVFINSLFGAAGNEHFIFFDNRIAEGITKTGQFIIRHTGDHVNSRLQQVFKKPDQMYSIYRDTDSLYFELKDVVDRVMPNETDHNKITDMIVKFFETKLVPWMKEGTDHVASTLNAYRNEIQFKQEAISSSGFWLAKKRYALRVIDNEGVRYSEPDTKIVGIEVVRSSTPAIARSWLKEGVELVLDYNLEGLREFVAKKEREFSSHSPDEIAFPRSVNNLAKYSSEGAKAIPIAVRSAIVHNNRVRSLGLGKKIDMIREGDKIKFVYLREPNAIRSNVIGFTGKLPVEFRLESYIDYNTQFQKVFLDPMTKIATAVSWTLTEANDLDSFF